MARRRRPFHSTTPADLDALIALFHDISFFSTTARGGCITLNIRTFIKI